MKIKLLSAAVMAVAAGNAMAIAPNVTPDLTLNISGATAVDKQIENYINQICDTNTLDTFVSVGGGATAFFCTVPAANSGLASDQNVLFRKESGGSSTGVEPVTNALTVDGIDLSTCLDDGSSFADAIAGDNQWGCSGTFIQVPSQVGISDVEPELFKISANGSKSVNLTPPGGLSVSPVNAQTFGIVVSPGLRDALQAAQGLTVGSDDVADMPSLSSNVIANIFAGNVGTWDELQDGTGTGIHAAAGLAAIDNQVNICVRTPGSGTQAQFNAFYMRNACAYRGAGDLGFLGFDTSLDSDGINQDGDAGTGDLSKPTNFFGQPLAPPYTYANKGSSDMGKCVTQITATLNSDKEVTGETGRWAIGIQSLEKVDEGRTDRNYFKYLAIDGVAPTLENVAAGLYHNWAAASIQWRNDQLNADQAVLADKLVQTAQAKDAVSVFNASLQDDGSSANDDRPAGSFRVPEILDGGQPANVGTLAFAGTIDPQTLQVLATEAPFNPANPVTPFNKGLVGPSSCAIATMADKVDVSQRH